MMERDEYSVLHTARLVDVANKNTMNPTMSTRTISVMVDPRKGAGKTNRPTLLNHRNSDLPAYKGFEAPSKEPL